MNMKKEVNSKAIDSTEDDIERKLNHLIKKISKDIELLKFNTSIAAMMKYVNEWEKARKSGIFISQKNVLEFLKLLAPFAPFITEELYQLVSCDAKSVHQSLWPRYDRSVSLSDVGIIPIQVNGKHRGQIILKVENIPSNERDLLKEAKKVVGRHLANKNVKKVIYVPGKIINFVT